MLLTTARAQASKVCGIDRLNIARARRRLKVKSRFTYGLGIGLFAERASPKKRVAMDPTRVVLTDPDPSHTELCLLCRTWHAMELVI
jgi:hypothetical protein